MPSLSDTLLDSGCALHIEAAHSESIKVLSGPDAGKSFSGVKENQEDMMLASLLNDDDPRAKRIIRFRNSGKVPNLNKLDLVQTDDSRVWRAVRAPQNDYLFTDFILTEKIGKDQ